MWKFLIDNQAVFLGLALAISETLALSPAVKANGIFDFIVKLLKSAAPKAEAPKV